ncbi:MAG: hypothetical protein HY909_19300 [Deltaproteobacteria bacterium]|nr:hypothetical protein [Deltaproteobacteria bacterium]
MPASNLRLALGVALLSLALACRPPAPRSVLDGHPDRNADCAARVDSPAVWAALASSPGRERFAHTDVVKVVIDLEDDWRVYFLQSRRWEIHYFFADRFLGGPAHPIEDHAAFNIREYRRADRRFILGTILHHRDTDRWCFELVAGDLLDVPRTVRAFQALRERVYFADRLQYHPVPPAHEAAMDQFRAAAVPMVTSEELYAGLRYQPVNLGTAYGYLRVVRGPVDPSRVRRTDVLVLDHVPLDLPVCAAVITTELQTPLAHLAVLATNRGTPDMALRDALERPEVRALEGHLVELRVTAQEWSLRETTEARAQSAWASLRPTTVTRPELSPRDPGLPDVRTLRRSDVDIAGAKASQLGELGSLGPPVLVPDAFVVPFSAYLSHLEANGLVAQRDAILDDPRLRDDHEARAARLQALREAIARAPVDPGLLQRVRQRIAERFPERRVRLRSSTNAEDLEGFNGAGLYRSVVVPAHADEATLADALRAVWASTWNLQAHEERSFFRVDEHLVAMAVLVQGSLDDDVVDGVAITGNPFNEGRPGYFINAQIARDEGGAVTSARGDQVPEQVLYYTYASEGEFERLSRSTLTGGAPVLTDPEVLRLAAALRVIHGHFVGDGWERGRAMDVEFLLRGRERQLVFVQARPYTLRYAPEQRMAVPPD